MAEADATGPAQLRVRFARAPSGRTYLKRQYAAFPFHITRPLHLQDGADGMATLVLQSLGAGLLQNDRVGLEIAVEAGAAARVTTQGSTVAHAMPRGHAVQAARLEIGARARLDYLPRPTVLFPGADVATSLEIVLHPGGTALWCDGFFGHDPEGHGRRFRRLTSETLLRDPAGEVLALDRFEIAGDALDEAGTMAGFPVHAGFGLAGVGTGACDRMRQALAAIQGIHAGVSALPNGAGLFARVLAADGVALARASEAVVGLAAPRGVT